MPTNKNKPNFLEVLYFSLRSIPPGVHIMMFIGGLLGGILLVAYFKFVIQKY